MKKILVIDVGGTHVKLMISPRGKAPEVRFRTEADAGASGQAVQKSNRDWNFEAVSIGFPAPVRDGKS